jgi:hypothetical protein
MKYSFTFALVVPSTRNKGNITDKELKIITKEIKWMVQLNFTIVS